MRLYLGTSSGTSAAGGKRFGRTGLAWLQERIGVWTAAASFEKEEVKQEYCFPQMNPDLFESLIAPGRLKTRDGSATETNGQLEESASLCDTTCNEKGRKA